MTAMKRNGNVWAKVLLGMIGAGAAIWIIIVSLGSAGTQEWEQYAASLRAKGQPITFAEIEARRTVIPDDQNSARVIESLAAALAEQRGGAATLDSISGSKEAADFFTGVKRSRIEAGREFLSRHQDILSKLTEILDKPSGRFAIQYDQKNPLATLIPHIPQVRSVSKLVRLNTTVCLVDGDTAGALRDFELQCRLAGTFGDQPILISRLVQIAVQAQAIATTEDMLRAGTTDDQSLKRMAEELQAMRKNGTLKWGLLGERAFFVETCEAILRGTMQNPDICDASSDPSCHLFPGSLLRLPAFLVRANQLRGVGMLTSLIDAVDDPKALNAAANKIEQEVPNLSRTQMLVKILMPSFTRAVFLNTRISAHLDSAIAALAAERFRLAEGRLPSTLEQLVPVYLPAVPIDPFDGKPLRMTKTDDGIVIYSVDENGVDDGGDVIDKMARGWKRAPDVGFRLHDADHRGVLLVDDPPSEED